MGDKEGSSDPNNARVPLLNQQRSGTFAGGRRKSKLTSGGRWDWSYDKDSLGMSRKPNDDDQTFGITFRVKVRRGWLRRKQDRKLSVSVPQRVIQLASEKRAMIFPTASVSRLTPHGDKSLEIRAANTVSKRNLLSGDSSGWIKTMEFESAANRDEFLNLVRGLNAVGGTVSSMYNRVGHLITREKLVKCLLAVVENEPGYEPPMPRPRVDENEFFRWFLIVSQDRDPYILLRKLEEALVDEEAGPSRKTSAATTIDKRPASSSISKRGPLFVGPKLLQDETVIIVEDTVTFVAKLDSREVRHLVGELILTNLRLYFSVYESELTSRSGMTAMNGVIGLAKYIGESELERVDGGGSSEDGQTNGGGSEPSFERAIPPPRLDAVVGTSVNSQSSINEGILASSWMEKELRASVPSLRFGRRPDTVFVSLNIFLMSLSKVESRYSSLMVETSLGRQCTFQFDRGDSYVASFVERVAEARKSYYFTLAIERPLSMESPPVYDPKEELSRQCTGALHASVALFDNAGYEVCSTYPVKFAVPSEFSKQTKKMAAVARFRSRARVPAVTWIHPTNNVVLARSSQPLTGIKQTRCAEDEELLSLMNGGKRMFVLDARGPAAVAGNQLVRGKGAEVPRGYPDVTFLFMGIYNIHTMRSSQEKLAWACNPGSFDSDRFLLKVEESKWLAHVRAILDASTRCAELLELEHATVLVHCSDGWDRTAQLVSLAQVILDPFYRTLQGLAVLVEKDWVAFGFKFRDRCFGPDEDEKSPIWAQFIDCLNQFRRQFPKHFQYNEEFLIALAEEPYCGRYATFGFNTEGERAEACRHNKSRAWEFWTDGLMRPEHRNVSFEPYEGPLWPNTSTRRMTLWEGLHLKYDAGSSISQSSV